MSMDLLKCYQVLGVPRGCTWEELRSAYRRQVQKHHPDRFQQQPDQQHLAKERMLELNKAFNTLEEYYKKNGVLPAKVLKKPEVEPLKQNHSDQARPKSEKTKPFDTADVKPARPKQTTHKTSWSLIIFLAVVGYYFFWESIPQTGDSYSSPANAKTDQGENPTLQTASLLILTRNDHRLLLTNHRYMPRPTTMKIRQPHQTWLRWACMVNFMKDLFSLTEIAPEKYLKFRAYPHALWVTSGSTGLQKSILIKVWLSPGIVHPAIR